ncbi:Ser/Thr phosphatase family protein [Bacteroidales bacterium KA00251]|nr:Ser/Thr phosphatase family protein [Bacteroidales bacterium KA00251]
MIYFIADTHFGSPLHSDELLIERTFVKWCEAIAPTAESLFLLGDIFDFWYEYRYVVPKGFVRVLGALAHLADSGVKLHYIVGNHDNWCRDYFQKELQVNLHPQAIELDLKGKIFRLAHGDEECRERSFREDFMYRLFRSPIARRLLSAIHPRWVIPLGLGSAEASRRHGDKKPYDKGGPIECEWLVKQAIQMEARSPEIDYFLFGHRHLLASHTFNENKKVVLLGDWLHYNSYASWDGNELSLYRDVSLAHPQGTLLNEATIE